MSMVKPIALTVDAFDALFEHKFYFTASGGNQVVKNKIVIRDNVTNATVYENTVVSYVFEHTVPANTLINGVYYNSYFITYDKDDNESIPSNTVTFRCVTTPVVEITNIPENGIIGSSNYIFNISYSQAENELIDFSRVILYDYNGNIMFTSASIYSAGTPPLTFTYELVGLTDNTTYKIKVETSTINGLMASSPIETFTTRYFTPSLYSLLQLENDCQNGYVKLKNNFYIIGFESNPVDIGNNPQYLYDDKLHLIESGTYINYNSGYTIDNDFTLRAWFENPIESSLISLYGNSNLNKITIDYITEYSYDDDNQMAIVELKCYNGSNLCYSAYSNYINIPLPINKLFLWVRRINDIFTISLEEKNNTYEELSVLTYENLEEYMYGQIGNGV